MKFKRLVVIIIGILIIGLSIKYIPKVIKRTYEYMYPYKYSSLVDMYSKEYNLNPFFVLSIIKVESDFDTNATSNVDAKGLMQITPKTGEYIAKKIGDENFTPEELYNPSINIKMGCWYLSNLFEEFNNKNLVIAAYNGGRGNVLKWLNNPKYSINGKVLNNIPFNQTKEYVVKVNKTIDEYKSLYS